jgi:hypothetical protein
MLSCKYLRRQPAQVLPVLKSISLRARSVAGVRGAAKEVLDWISSLDLRDQSTESAR